MKCALFSKMRVSRSNGYLFVTILTNTEHLIGGT